MSENEHNIEVYSTSMSFSRTMTITFVVSLFYNTISSDSRFKLEPNPHWSRLEAVNTFYLDTNSIEAS